MIYFFLPYPFEKCCLKSVWIKKYRIVMYTTDHKNLDRYFVQIELNKFFIIIKMYDNFRNNFPFVFIRLFKI